MLEKNENSDAFIKGVFKQEIKNRFLCEVEIKDKIHVCYIPSSSKLNNFIDLQNKEVLLIPTEAKNARTEYSVYAIKKKHNYIILNTSVPNKVINNEIHKRHFSFLGKRNKVSREKRIHNYKCDLFIDDTQTIVEIKSIITEKSIAHFPTVHSERANNQLKHILELINKGYRVAYCFVSLNPYVKEIIVNNTELEYYNLFKECVKKGMLFFGEALEIKNGQPAIKKTIHITLE